jgi:hypothetical protein
MSGVSGTVFCKWKPRSEFLPRLLQPSRYALGRRRPEASHFLHLGVAPNLPSPLHVAPPSIFLGWKKREITLESKPN